jgi:hypothetical protein
MVSHDPRCQKATHVAAPSEHLVDDNVSMGGEKGQVKQVGRKRRLALSASSDSNSNYADEDYQPPASGDVDYEEPAPKRSRHVEEADEKQSGCTDEWQVPSSPLLDEEDDEEDSSTSSSSENEEDNEDVIEVPHPPPRTWVAKVEWALGRRGGKGTLADIYTTIEAAFPEEVDGKRNWKAAIRSCLSKNEKRKFYKPHAHGSSLAAGSGKDHLWSLVVPREGGATRPAVRRGRPAGRRATTTRRMTTRHARLVEEQQQQQPPQQQHQQQEEKAQELVMVHPQELMDELDDLPDVKEERMAQLLRQKELLEQDIHRLLEDNNADCADGLSPDQEDFLSHLLA